MTHEQQTTAPMERAGEVAARADAEHRAQVARFYLDLKENR